MAACPVVASDARPAFLPASVDYDALPETVRRALVFVVGPLYEELVAGARSFAERAAGGALVLLTTLEVIEQFDLAQATDFTTVAAETDEQRMAREKLMRAHLRLVGRKLRVARLVLRLQRLRQQDPLPIQTLVAQLMAHPSGEKVFSRNRDSTEQRHPIGEPPRCRRPPLAGRAAASCGANRKEHSVAGYEKTQTETGLKRPPAVCCHRAGWFPSEKFLLQNCRSTEQRPWTRAGPRPGRSGTPVPDEALHCGSLGQLRRSVGCRPWRYGMMQVLARNRRASPDGARRKARRARLGLRNK